MRQFKLVAAIAAVALVACGPQKVDPTLAIVPTPRTIDGDGSTASVRVVTTDDVGAPGTGTVHVTSAAGSLVDGADVTLANGEGKIDFSCDRSIDATCTGQVKLTAKWNDLTVSTNETVKPAPALLSLSASPATLPATLGGIVAIDATWTVDGVATAGASVTLSSSSGALENTDGTPYTPGTTDSAGQVHAQLVAPNTAGMVTITATGPGNVTKTATVTFTEPTTSITLDTDRSVITLGYNQQAHLTATVTVEGSTQAGRQVNLTTSGGTLKALDGGTFTSPATTNASGQVEALLYDVGSAGTATVTATEALSQQTASQTITFATPNIALTVTSSKPNVYTNVGDSALITAKLLSNGAPVTNQQLNLSTNLGTLTLTNGGAFTGSALTDAQGQVMLLLNDTGVSGTATITVTDPLSSQSANTTVGILDIGSVMYQNATCGGVVCTLMGVKYSGYNTQANLAFVVRDATSNAAPVAGVRVTFTLNSAPTGTTTTASGVTDNNGKVIAVVNSGPAIGSFSLTATVDATHSATSSTIGVRGAKVANNGLSFYCDQVNFSSFITTSPPIADLSTVCHLALTDRNTNHVGTGTTVQLLTEFGTITASVPTQIYDPGQLANEGTGSVTFRTKQNNSQTKDYDPLPADPNQFPYARPAEPSRIDGQLTRNPRDGLIAVVAFTDGEEWFAESNGNGTRDCDGGTTCEQFIDQGEPFVDNNDNDTWDPGETYVDTNMNSAWDGPNGVWDSDSKVWVKTYVLFTDALDPTTFSANTYNVPLGGSSSVNVYGFDGNLNPLAPNTSFAFARTAGVQGGVSFTGRAVNTDGLGMTVEPMYVVAPDGGACGPTEPRCEFHTIFHGWSDGYLGKVTGTQSATLGSGQVDVTEGNSWSLDVTTTNTLHSQTVTVGTTGNVMHYPVTPP